MYNYEAMKPKLFTEEMQVVFLKVRDKVKTLLTVSGAATMSRIIDGIGGDVWESMACVDRLVELEEIREVELGFVPTGQNRIFMR